MMPPSPRASDNSRRSGRLVSAGVVIIVASIAFLLGFQLGSGGILSGGNHSCEVEVQSLKSRLEYLRHQLEQDAKEDEALSKHKEGVDCPLCPGSAADVFTQATSSFAVAATKVHKHQLMAKFDTGIPLQGGRADAAGFDHSTENESFIFYSRPAAIPKFMKDDEKKEKHNFALVPVDQAVENCEVVNILFTQNRANQCLAIVGNRNSVYNGHLIRFLRRDLKEDFSFSSRGHPVKGDEGFPTVFPPPESLQTVGQWKRLEAYFRTIRKTADDLKPKLTRLAYQDGLVVVTAVNSGQADLLINWLCSADSKAGVNLRSRLIVFCLDEKMEEIATKLGLTAFYSKDIMGDMPSNASARFGDKTFNSLMFGKLAAPQLVSMLGFDFVFCDVDIVWYRNPIEFFKQQPEHWDLMFQDDGNRNMGFMPYAANSGFYYARNNLKTQYFFRNALYNAENVKEWSQQMIFGALLPEYVSLFGMRVKTLQDTDFPSGFHYVMRKDYMKKLVQGDVDPWIFHMHWTANSKEKKEHMKQMGMWFVKEDGSSCTDLGCCSQEPIVECFRPDEPYVQECETKSFAYEAKGGKK